MWRMVGGTALAILFVHFLHEGAQTQPHIDVLTALDDTGSSLMHPKKFLGTEQNFASCTAAERTIQATILRETARWRNRSWIFTDKIYKGPWLEENFFDYWLETAQECPVGGRYYLPIFWQVLTFDLKCYKAETPCTQDDFDTLDRYMQTLDRSKRYFTISRHRGLTIQWVRGLNIVTFVGGDLTHVPESNTMAKVENRARVTNVVVPHLKVEMVPRPGVNKKRFASFAGDYRTSPIRQMLFTMFHNRNDVEFYVNNPQAVVDGMEDAEVPISSKDKQFDYALFMQESTFCFCPRGYASATYRLFEAMQLGTFVIVKGADSSLYSSSAPG